MQDEIKSQAEAEHTSLNYLQVPERKLSTSSQSSYRSDRSNRSDRSYKTKMQAYADTGAGGNVMTVKRMEQLTPKPKLRHSTTKL